MFEGLMFEGLMFEGLMFEGLMFEGLVNKKSRLFAAPGCGGRDRTTDLQVMSLTSYHCSTPRYNLIGKATYRAIFP